MQSRSLCLNDLNLPQGSGLHDLFEKEISINKIIGETYRIKHAKDYYICLLSYIAMPISHSPQYLSLCDKNIQPWPILQVDL